MQNINELLGIISGINYDGIINNLEAKRLQEWVDRNRNLVYEPQEEEIIALVDSALEDQIIDDKERTLLIQRSEEFLSKNIDNTNRIYELNGIIEGVVCDGVVNDAEVSKLHEWMNRHGSIIRKDPENDELCKGIDRILNDNIVTEEEQQELIALISQRIAQSNFEAKLERLCKQVSLRKNIGPDLVDILDNESAMREIHYRAQVQLFNTLSSYSGSCTHPEIIVVSLVLIAMLGYSDGNFYKSVRSTYKTLYDFYSEQKVEGHIRTILNRYKHKDNANDRTRIISVALENAIVPEPYLAQFFEFIFDIYKINFEYDLPNSPYEDFKFVYEGLRNIMLSEGDEVSIKVTQKTYKLIATTKHLILQEDGLDALIKFSIMIIKLIDKYYWNKNVRISNPYLLAGFEQWERGLKEPAHGSRMQKESKTEFRSHWEPRFFLSEENYAVCLVTPTHKIKSQYDYRDISVVVCNGEEELYRNDCCDIREIIGGYQIKPLQIEIKRPLGRLTYKLLAGSDIIYDSKEKLYRDYIVFNQEGLEVNNNTDYDGVAYFCYSSIKTTIENLCRTPFYEIGYKLIKNSDTVEIGQDVFNFSRMIRPGIFGTQHKNCYIKETGEKEFWPVYKEVSTALFETSSANEKFEIVINGKAQKLTEMDYKTFVYGANVRYVVNLDIQRSGFYSLEINRIIAGRKEHILKENFACDVELEYYVHTVDDQQFNVEVCSGIFQDVICKEVTVEEYNPDFLQFVIEGTAYSYFLPLDLGLYRIDDGKWCSSTEEMWIGDISLESTMLVYDSQYEDLLVYTDKGLPIEEGIKIKTKGPYCEIPIGFLNSYEKSTNYVVLVFIANGKMKRSLFCYNKCEISPEQTEILFQDSPKGITITPVFHGKGKVYFEMLRTNGECVYKSQNLDSGGSDVFNGFRSFEEYKFIFYEKQSGLVLKKTPLYQMKQAFYAREDFINRVFKINEIFFNQLIRGQFVEKSMHLSKAYVRIIDVIDNESFRGEIFVKTMRGEWVLEEINPVRIELCSNIIEDTLDLYITNEDDGGGLLIDFEKHGILNALEHKTAPDIFLYTVNVKGEAE